MNEAVQTGLLANGEFDPGKMQLEVLDRVNTTREELRHMAAYRAGRVLEVLRSEKTLRLKPGLYRIQGWDRNGRQVELEGKGGKRFRFDPSKIKAGDDRENLALLEPRNLDVHEGDRIRWTRNDHRRELFNADRAKIVAIEAGRVTVETSKGEQVVLRRGDPMLKRIDLAYALNAHMAQGLTSDRGIAVMDSRERNLANQKTFLVTVTRLRDHLTLVVDNASRLGGAVSRNKGEKASALEVTERLRSAAERGSVKGLPAKADKSAEQELIKERSRSLDLGL